MGKFGLDFKQPDGKPQVSVVDQSLKASTDFNVLLKGYNTKNLPVIPILSQIVDSVGLEYSDMMIAVSDAKNSFNELPIAIRKRFGHDPQLLMEFIADENNYDEAVKLGLCTPRHSEAEHTTMQSSPAASDKNKKPAKAGSVKKAPSAPSNGDEVDQSD